MARFLFSVENSVLCSRIPTYNAFFFLFYSKSEFDPRDPNSKLGFLLKNKLELIFFNFCNKIDIRFIFYLLSFVKILH